MSVISPVDPSLRDIPKSGIPRSSDTSVHHSPLIPLRLSQRPYEYIPFSNGLWGVRQCWGPVLPNQVKKGVILVWKRGE